MPLITADIEAFLGKIQWQAKHLQTHVLHREPEEKALLYFSLGSLSDSYVQAAEECLRQGKGPESSYFAAKAQFVRNAGFETFGGFPEKDYQTGLYKPLTGLVIHIPDEKLQQVAQFCSQNIKPDEKLLSDPKALGAELNRRLRGAPLTGIHAKYFDVLWRKFKEFREKPSKWGDIYELVLLADNVRQVSDMLLKKEGKEKKEKAGLEGFRVRKRRPANP